MGKAASSKGTTAPRPANVGGIAGEQLRSIIDRIERLTEERQALADDLKDVYAEAKGNGFCTKTLKRIVQLRKRDRAELDEEETMLEVYMRALGMLPDIDEADESSPPAPAPKSPSDSPSKAETILSAVLTDHRDLGGDATEEPHVHVHVRERAHVHVHEEADPVVESASGDRWLDGHDVSHTGPWASDEELVAAEKAGERAFDAEKELEEVKPLRMKPAVETYWLRGNDRAQAAHEARASRRKVA